MTYDTTAKNEALDAIGDLAVRVALHTGDPGGANGAANELNGSGYARGTVTWDPASGGAKHIAADVVISVPAVTITWASLWNAAGTVRYDKKELAAPAVFGTPGTATLTDYQLT